MGVINAIARLFGSAHSEAPQQASSISTTDTSEQRSHSMGSNNTAEAYKNNRVGPIIRGGDVAQAAIEAAEVDNPGKEIHVEDRSAYIRLEAEGEFVLKRETLEEMLGRHFEMRELEINLSSFAGQIDMDSDQVKFYLMKSI